MFGRLVLTCFLFLHGIYLAWPVKTLSALLRQRVQYFVPGLYPSTVWPTSSKTLYRRVGQLTRTLLCPQVDGQEQNLDLRYKSLWLTQQMVPSGSCATRASSLLRGRTSSLQWNLSLALAHLNDEAVGYLHNSVQKIVLKKCKNCQSSERWQKFDVNLNDFRNLLFSL